jgi:hypothetical protein
MRSPATCSAILAVRRAQGMSADSYRKALFTGERRRT